MYRLGDMVFVSKKEVRRACRKLFYKFDYDPYVLSGIHDVPDKRKAFVRDLLSYTPSYAEADKYGEPEIFIDLSRDPKFLLVGVRDDKYTVSLTEALMYLEKNTNSYRRLYRNARRNIRRQIRMFVNVEIERGVMCVLSNKMINPDDAEVHHVIPFSELFIGYLDSIGITPKTIPADVSDVLSGWAKYHKDHAVLCLLSKRAHSMIENIPPVFQDMLAKNSKKLSDVYDERERNGTDESSDESDVV